MRPLSTLLAAASLAALAGTALATPSGFVPTRQAHQAAPAAAAAAGKVIEYRNGPVMTSSGGAHVYLIWYGDWSNNTGPAIVSDFVQNLGGSAWYNINTTYKDASGKAIANQVTLSGQTEDHYSQGTTLSNKAVGTVVKRAIASGALPKDANGVYFVLTSKDVKQGKSFNSFCNLYCGWHDTGTASNTTIRYAFVGDAARCLSSCAAQSTSPNGNPGVDGMISVLAHELTETVTDPDTASGWRFYSTDGNENADECAWTFGTEYTVANGSSANMHLGSRDYLVQQNWVRGIATETCAVGF